MTLGGFTTLFLTMCVDYKSKRFQQTVIIPVSTRVGCQISSIKMESFQTNRDLYNFCSISGCSQDCDASADKLEFFLKRSFSEEAKKSLKDCLKIFLRRTSEKWQKTQRKEDRFLKKEEKWLYFQFFINFFRSIYFQITKNAKNSKTSNIS
jgi:hypothetical protein